MKVLENNKFVDIKADNTNFSSVLDPMSFQVETVDTTDLLGMETNTEREKTIVAVRNDGTMKALNFCSKKYNALNPFEYWTQIAMILIANNIEFEFHAELKNDVYFNAQFVIKKMNGKDIGLRVGDNNDLLYYTIFVGSSLNGLQQYSICGGFFRLICENGLKVWYNSEYSFDYKGKHTNKMQLALEDLEQKLLQFIDEKGYKEIGKKFTVLYDSKIDNYAERVEAVMSAIGIKKGADEVMATIRTEMAQLNETKPNDWFVYNGINALIYDNTKNVKSADVRDELDKKVMAYLMA